MHIESGDMLPGLKGISDEEKAAACKFMEFLTSLETAGRLRRFTGYIAPRMQAYDLPEMKKYIDSDPNAKVALSQLKSYIEKTTLALPWEPILFKT